MNKPTINDTYRCHWCSTLNNAMTADWCLCAAAQQTLVCTGCLRCFCAAPTAVNRKFWELASTNVISRRWQAPKPEVPQAESSAGRPVLLVVDDTKAIHTVIDSILTGFFGTIIHEYNGAEAFKLARRVKPEIVLTDALLPGLDGRDVVRLLKSDPSTSSIQTILMTGLYKGVRYRNEAFRNFLVDAYLEKPVGAAELRSTIQELLAKIAPATAVAS